MVIRFKDDTRVVTVRDSPVIYGKLPCEKGHLHWNILYREKGTKLSSFSKRRLSEVLNVTNGYK